MKVTPEMMAKFEQCKSVEKMLELAKYEKFSLTREQAQKAFDYLQSEDISDDDLEKICGGSTAIYGNRIDSQNDILSFILGWR